MIQYFYSHQNHGTLDEISDFQSGVWVRVYDPTREEIAELSRRLKVEEDLLLDALDPFEVSRLEREKGNTYIFLEVPFTRMESTGESETMPVLFVLGEEFLLSVSRAKRSFLEGFVAGKKIIQTEKSVETFFQFLRAIIGEYTGHLTHMGRAVRRVSTDVGGVRVQDLARFVSFEKRVNEFLVALVPMRSIVRSLEGGRYGLLSEESASLAEDIALDIDQLIERSQSLHKHIVDIREASSVIASHRLNQSIRILTVFTIILSVPMVLGSLYGMNVPLPLSDAHGVFWGIVGVSVLVMLGMFLFLTREK